MKPINNPECPVRDIVGHRKSDEVSLSVSPTPLGGGTGHRGDTIASSSISKVRPDVLRVGRVALDVLNAAAYVADLDARWLNGVADRDDDWSEALDRLRDAVDAWRAARCSS